MHPLMYINKFPPSIFYLSIYLSSIPQATRCDNVIVVVVVVVGGDDAATANDYITMIQSQSMQNAGGEYLTACYAQ